MELNRIRNTAFAQGIINLITSTGIGVCITLIEIPIIKIILTKKKLIDRFDNAKFLFFVF